MATRQKKELLTYFDLLNNLLFIKERAKALGLTDEQIRNLKFVKKNTIDHRVTYTNKFDLNLAKDKEQIVIIMLEKF